MRVETGLDGDRLGSAGITIGTFDGVHLAHAEAIRHLLEVSSANGWSTMVITFDNHPRRVLDPDHCPHLITTLDEKLEILDGLGVHTTWVMPFTRELAALGPDDFMRQVGSRIDIRHLVSGPDFALGHERSGDNAWLADYGRRNGFATEVMPSLKVDGKELHSSDIRQLLEAGEVSRAARLLGRPFGLRGAVETGAKIGRRLGFPTANLAVPPGKLIPADGIYATRVKLPAGEWPGALSIGRRPTFDGERRVVEVHVLDFSGDLYGVEIAVQVIERLRGQERYEGIEDLVSQIALDVEETRRLVAG